MAYYELREHKQARTVGIYRTNDGMPVLVRDYGSYDAARNIHALFEELKPIMWAMEQEIQHVLSKATT